MLKQYKTAVIGAVCMLAVIAVTGLISFKEEQPLENSVQMMEENTTSADKEQIAENPVLVLSGSMSGEAVQPVQENPMTETTTEQELTETETTEQETTAAQELTELETIAETSDFDGYVLPVVDVYLNIREKPSTDCMIIGKLYVGSKAKIIEELDGWYKISSGTVEGYVSSEYTVTGKAAEKIAREDGKTMVTVLGSGLRVRENPGTDADVLSIVGEGDQFEVAEEQEGWVGIRYTESKIAYLSADYVDINFELGEAVSIEEELESIRKAEEEAARKAAEEARAIEKTKAETAERLANSEVVETVINEGYAATYDDTYLLACLVQMEASGEPYEGKLAVANVVLNRVRCGYGSTIAEVIYAKNQFTGANTGALASILAKGPSDECMQAAVDALSGVNNIGDYRNFIALSWANFDMYSEYTIISNHCFYKR